MGIISFNIAIVLFVISSLIFFFLLDWYTTKIINRKKIEKDLAFKRLKGAVDEIKNHIKIVSIDKVIFDNTRCATFTKEFLEDYVSHGKKLMKKFDKATKECSFLE